MKPAMQIDRRPWASDAKKIFRARMFLAQCVNSIHAQRSRVGDVLCRNVSRV
jgi:hypothetical protein